MIEQNDNRRIIFKKFSMEAQHYQGSSGSLGDGAGEQQFSQASFPFSSLQPRIDLHLLLYLLECPSDLFEQRILPLKCKSYTFRVHTVLENAHNILLNLKVRLQNIMECVFDIENRQHDWLLNLESILFSPFWALCNLWWILLLYE